MKILICDSIHVLSGPPKRHVNCILSQLKRAGTSPNDLLGFYCSLIRSMLESSCQLLHCSLRICLQKFLIFGEQVNNSIIVKDS